MTTARDDSDERYVTPFDLPTAHERELLTILSKEAAEVIVAASKLQRFGRENGYPGTSRTSGASCSQSLGAFTHMTRD